jgi:hypothetical protein
MMPHHGQRKISSPQLGPSSLYNGSGTRDIPPLMHNVSFSNSALFPQTSSGSNHGNGDNQPSNISPFLAPQNNPQFQGPMLYQSPSFGSGNPMSVAP